MVSARMASLFYVRYASGALKGHGLPICERIQFDQALVWFPPLTPVSASGITAKVNFPPVDASQPESRLQRNPEQEQLKVLWVLDLVCERRRVWSPFV